LSGWFVLPGSIDGTDSVYRRRLLSGALSRCDELRSRKLLSEHGSQQRDGMGRISDAMPCQKLLSGARDGSDTLRRSGAPGHRLLLSTRDANAEPVSGRLDLFR
jgi:hypothetical protein